MDEQAAAVRAMVDENGGKWIGRIYTLLGELGYADITPEIGSEIQTRLSAANLSVKPDLALPGLLRAGWVSVTAVGGAPPVTGPWVPFASVTWRAAREDEIDAALPSTIRAADQQGWLEPPAGSGQQPLPGRVELYLDAVRAGGDREARAGDRRRSLVAFDGKRQGAVTAGLAAAVQVHRCCAAGFNQDGCAEERDPVPAALMWSRGGRLDHDDTRS